MIYLFIFIIFYGVVDELLDLGDSRTKEKFVNIKHS